eukprot:CAMPEP_0175482198 /NCGR_PEP_ID=MMETSP0095-20121207/78839_1 /TAXON_ID=311494 /ORGANISM="Alexandrium monilatum, Strain CCMP3105" /LENGTH=643 /DNA_ID=CAMNT_0016783849 /DNA_START=20 /DNA_END=1951 /DNA_ORIENTATION=+
MFKQSDQWPAADDISGNSGGIFLPQTLEVQQQLQDGGPQLTCRDVAAGIIDRLLNSPHTEQSEILFLKAYIESPAYMTSIPLQLLQRFGEQSDESQLDTFLLSTLSGGTRGALGPQSWVMNSGSVGLNTARRKKKSKTHSMNLEVVTRVIERSSPRLKTWTAEAFKEAGIIPGVQPLSGKVDVVRAERAAWAASRRRPAADGARPQRRSEAAALPEHVAKNSVFSDSIVEFAAERPLPHATKASTKVPAILESSPRNSTDFDDWGFDVFEEADLTMNRPLHSCGWEVLSRHGLVEKFGIDKAKGSVFLTKTEAFYSSRDVVFYHNSVHAADVTQTVHSLMLTFGFGAFFSPLNKLSLLLSAIIHDMGHDGRNNAFHVARFDDLALMYNDSSVLENYHLSQGFRLLLRDSSANILLSLKPEQISQVRQEMIYCVKATDMAAHMSHMGTFKGKVEKLGSKAEDWIAEGPAAINEAQAMLLHAADVGTSSKPLGISDRWANMLREEFYAQGDEERRLNMPVSALCDRGNKFASSQAGFIQFIVQPVFALLGQASPKVRTVISEQLKANLGIWQERKALEAEVESPAGGGEDPRVALEVLVFLRPRLSDFSAEADANPHIPGWAGGRSECAPFRGRCPWELPVTCTP